MTEIYVYTIEELATLFCSFVPIGILLTAFPLIVGFTIYGLLKVLTRL